MEASELMEKLQYNMKADSDAVRATIHGSGVEPIIELIEARYSQVMDKLHKTMKQLELDVDMTGLYQKQRR